MSTISRLTTWSDGQTLTASALNGEFNNILNDYNGSITNANISNTAAIAFSKLASTPATVTGVETFTNKTLTKPIFQARVFSSQSYSPSGGGTATLDCSVYDVHSITMPAGNIIVALSSDTINQPIIVRIINDSSVRTITWFTTIKWPNGSAPTLSGSSKVDTFAFLKISGGAYDGYIVGTSLS